MGELVMGYWLWVGAGPISGVGPVSDWTRGASPTLNLAMRPWFPREPVGDRSYLASRSKTGPTW